MTSQRAHWPEVGDFEFIADWDRVPGGLGHRFLPSDRDVPRDKIRESKTLKSQRKSKYWREMRAGTRGYRPRHVEDDTEEVTASELCLAHFLTRMRGR